MEQQLQPSPFTADHGYDSQPCSGYYGTLPGAYPAAASPSKSIDKSVLLMMWLMPWALFVLVFGTFSFYVHYMYPTTILVSTYISLSILGIMLIKDLSRLRNPYTDKHSTLWSAFFVVSLTIAIGLGMFLGDVNYVMNESPVYFSIFLNKYYDLDPGATRGNAVMDGGIVKFSSGSHVDTTKATGFKNRNVWCVAPIVKDEAPATGSYDFWAIGEDCCSGEVGDFGNCLPDSNEEYDAPWGIVLMDDKMRPYYELAVQQAVASSNVTSLNPRLYRLTMHPNREWGLDRAAGFTTYFEALLGYNALQAGLVAMAKAMLE